MNSIQLPAVRPVYSIHTFPVWQGFGRFAAGMTLLLLLGARAGGQATQPALPPPSADPNRPAGIKQSVTRPNSGSDAQGRAYERSSVGSWTNYDESKADLYPLPDPLRLKNGQAVKDAQTWWKQRRPEILNDFLTEMYGRVPQDTPRVTWEVTATNTSAAGGAAIMKRVLGRIDNSRYPKANPSINITLYTPANAAVPVPVILVVVPGPGGYGAPRPGAPVNDPEPRPGSPLYQLLSIGWGYATMEVGPVQNDYGGGLSSGIIGLMAAGAPRQPQDWGALSAWAWGLSRAMDYFETDKSVDAGQIGIEGHSRYGKAALLAAAIDQRWAIVFASCSGEGGAKLSRRNFGQTLDNIAGSYWMAGNFRKYAGHWNDLPVDAHELIALVAPRPAFITGGTQDQWADPHGEFLAAVGAGPVYRLLGKQDLGTTQMPAPDASLISGALAFRFHAGGHTDTIDWPVFLQFAQRYLKVHVRNPASKGLSRGMPTCPPDRWPSVVLDADQPLVGADSSSGHTAPDLLLPFTTVPLLLHLPHCRCLDRLGDRGLLRGMESSEQTGF